MMLGEYRVENFIHIKIFKNFKITQRSLDRNYPMNESNIFTLPYRKNAGSKFTRLVRSFSIIDVFVALKGSQFLFLFAITAAGVVPCGVPKMHPVHRP